MRYRGSRGVLYSYFFTTLLFAAISILAFPAEAAGSTLVWGGSDEAPNIIEIVDGGTYAAPIGAAAPAYISSNLALVTGNLYKVDPNDPADRTLVAERIMRNVGEFNTVFAWPSAGSYELDVLQFGTIQLMFNNPLQRILVRSGILGVAEAQFAPQLVETLHFTITDGSGCSQDCFSNVLFLPGIESSRLYKPESAGLSEKKIWEPGLNDNLHDLYLNPQGKSVNDTVYAKDGDIVDETPTGANIYKSFIAKMNEMKSQGLINDWQPAAYDWRLSLSDVLGNGSELDGKLFYSDTIGATSTPYIIQELRRLAQTSKTGKVTVIAHSNGGLVAKKLTEALGAEAPDLIDKMIFVAVPQAGTPVALLDALHGEPIGYGFVASRAAVRTFASTSPMTYHLLPSANYFSYVDDPVVSFDTSLSDWIAKYGSVIQSQESLHNFLTDSFGRVDAETGDTNQPIQLYDSLLSDAEALHGVLDLWTPPEGVQFMQIAGWGVPTTVKGIEYQKKNAGVAPDIQFTVDGDGTVVVPSALWTSTTTGAVSYWVDLQKYNARAANQISFGLLSVNHGDILEVPKLLDFLSDKIIEVAKPLSDYTYLSIQSPPATDLRLQYALHSPLTLDLYDEQGRHTGVSTTTGQVEEQVPGTYYAQFGDVKYIFSDASTTARLIMNGYAPGAFTFNVNEYTGDTLVASTTFKDIPTTANTTVSLDVQSDISTLSPMSIDQNGDGIIDATLAPKLNDTVTLDMIPPELQITFSTSTKSVFFIGADDVGTTTVTATTSYPALKKKQKKYHGTATTTVTVRDGAGNTAVLVYTEQLPSPKQRDTIVLRSLSYNGVSTPLYGKVSYKWRLAKNGSFKLFASHLRTASTTLESHYRPKKNKTMIMLKPRELDDSDSDDDSDRRPTKLKLPGMVIPYISTKDGNLIIGY